MDRRSPLALHLFALLTSLVLARTSGGEPLAEPSSATRPPALGRYVYRAWSEEHGLPHNTVRAIVQGRDGYLWLGTQAGLARFDGQNFRVFDHSNVPAMVNDQIQAFALDPNGVLWIGTYGGGLLRYGDGHFRRFDRADGLPATEVLSLALDSRQQLWVATQGGAVARFESGRLVEVLAAGRLPETTITQLLFDPAGDLWLVTPSGLGRYRGGQLDFFGHSAGLPTTRLRAVQCRRAGGFWVATDAGLLAFDPGASKFFDPWEPGVARPGQLSSLQVDGDSLWLGSTQGLFRFDTRSGALESFAAPHPMAGTFALELFLDPLGSLWAGSLGGGLQQLRQSPLQTWRRSDGLTSDFVTSITETAEGKLLVTTRNAGLSLVDPSSGKVEQLDRQPPDLDLWSALEHQGDWWLGSSGLGLLRHHRGAWRSYGVSEGLGRGAVFCVAATRDGTLWAGTNGGLSRLEGDHLRNFTTADGLPSNEVRILFEDREGVFWVGTTGGLARTRDATRQQFVAIDHPSLAQRSVAGIWQDELGHLWLATAGALVRMADGQIRGLTARDGLHDDELSYVQGDGQGFLWLGTARGLLRIPLGALRAAFHAPPADPTPAELPQWVFDRRDGLPGNIWNQGVASLRSRSGRLYFGSRGGLIEVDPARLSPRPAPAVFLEPAAVEGEPFDWSRFWRLGSSRLAFRFGSPELQAPDAVGWRARLVGFEDEWAPVSPDRWSVYHVPPGKYRFQVMAHGEEGHFAPPQEIEVDVAHRWARLAAVVGAALVGLVAGMTLLHTWRLRRHHVRERELRQRVEVALADLKVLRGMLPICSLCKKIRDDAGYWGDLESYVANHSDLELSRESCPDCTKKAAEKMRSSGNVIRIVPAVREGS